MCGGMNYKIVSVKKISYKDYYILVEKRLRYPIRSKKIFYDITADTKEIVEYERKKDEMNKRYGYSKKALESKYNSKEFKALKDPNYNSKTDVHKHTYLWENSLGAYLRWNTIKTQKDIDERVKLFKKKIREVTKK